MKTAIFSAAFALLIAMPLAAAAEGFADVQVVRVHGTYGLEAGGGTRALLGPVYLAAAVGGFVYKGEVNRHYWSTNSNGQQVCRSSSSGQYANNRDCGGAGIRGYGLAEAGIKFNRYVQAGAGVRVGEQSLPYGVLMLGDMGQIRLVAGKDYASVGLRGAF